MAKKNHCIIFLFQKPISFCYSVKYQNKHFIILCSLCLDFNQTSISLLLVIFLALLHNQHLSVTKILILSFILSLNILLFMLLQLLQFPPFPLYPAYLLLPQSIPKCCPYPWVIHICSLTSPFTFFYLVSTSPLTAVSLLHVSMLLVLFCLLVYFAHQIPLKSEIIWYFSFTNWLISLSINNSL